MLSVAIQKRVIFNLDDWVNPLGDTGAYLLYSVARISGIFKKAGTEITLNLDAPSAEAFGEETERALLGHLLQYPATIGRAAEACDPSIIAGFAYEGARLFNQFFANCPILAAEDSLKETRLRLSALTYSVTFGCIPYFGYRACIVNVIRTELRDLLPRKGHEGCRQWASFIHFEARCERRILTPRKG